MLDPLRLLTRRRLLQFGAGAPLGLNLGGLCRALAACPADATPTDGPPPLAACILIFQYGGPSQLDTFDPKPDAPAEIRGEFATIATSAPNLRICEHLPMLAKWMHKAALIRSMTHQARLHDSAAIHTLTGRPLEGPDRELFTPLPQAFPSYGAGVARLAQRARRAEVPFAALPFAFRNVVTVPCQGGGMLGPAYDPLQIEVDPDRRAYRADSLSVSEGIDTPRRHARRALLRRIQHGPTHEPLLTSLPEKAHRLLDSETLRRAIAIEREPAAVRERYGFGDLPATVGEGGGGGNGAELGYARQMRAQNYLLARRLVEAGVPFVNVYDFRQQGQNWDAHFRCANQHKSFLLPQADRGISALIEDLDSRGLLDSTLVVVMGEFGRTPRINHEGGRDHWPDCYSVLLAGGGVCGGAVYGSSDRFAAYPASDPVTPGDLAATIYWRFGIDPATEIHDPTGRPHRLATGEPLRRLFGAG